MGRAGVYMLHCRRNRAIYIGSSTDVDGRLYRHMNMLGRGCHENSRLQNTYNKYGADSFEAVELASCSSESTLSIEQLWIDLFRDSGRLLNLNLVASRPPAFGELDPEVRERKRKAHQKPTGRAASQKLLAHLAQRTGSNNPNFGTKWAPERVIAMREKMKGEGSPTYGMRGEKSPIYGIKRSAETRALMSQNNRWRGVGGAEHPSSKACKRIERDGTATFFESARDAASALGVANSTVVRWCTGMRTPIDGSTWSYLS